MDLFFHVFNLNPDLSVLAGSLANLTPVLVLVTCFFHEQLPVIKFKINHILSEDVIVANL